MSAVMRDRITFGGRDRYGYVVTITVYHHTGERPSVAVCPEMGRAIRLDATDASALGRELIDLAGQIDGRDEQ